MCILSACWMTGHWEYLYQKILRCHALKSAHDQCCENMSSIVRQSEMRVHAIPRIDDDAPFL